MIRGSISSFGSRWYCCALFHAVRRPVSEEITAAGCMSYWSRVGQGSGESYPAHYDNPLDESAVDKPYYLPPWSAVNTRHDRGNFPAHASNVVPWRSSQPVRAVPGYDSRILLLFDLNGTLTSHTSQRKSAGVNRMRPGLQELRRLQVWRLVDMLSFRQLLRQLCMLEIYLTSYETSLS